MTVSMVLMEQGHFSLLSVFNACCHSQNSAFSFLFHALIYKNNIKKDAHLYASFVLCFFFIVSASNESIVDHKSRLLI